MPALTSVPARAGRRPRNDPAQYDDLAAEWWKPRGAFAALHWLAAARGALIPLPDPQAAGEPMLLDVACGGGLLAPHVRGYRHVGVDIGEQATRVARDHGVAVARCDVAALPVRDASVDVVVAGEIFEHVADLDRVVGEIARVLRPGGTLVCDTLAATRLARFLLVTLAERIPGVAPRGIHDAALFVDPRRLTSVCARHHIRLRVRGLRPVVRDALLWRIGRRADVRMRPMRYVGVLYQGVGTKRRVLTRGDAA
ncbi:MAG: methyltransferase domain-containing protein [Mycobacteriales bacterium]|nr:methyltransferase domain-containing protein [Frankia sp.]